MNTLNQVQKKNQTLTLGIFAHSNAGKTTITEQLLHHTGVIEHAGRVDKGNTATDSLKVEKERGISVKSALVTFELNGKKIQLVDTPGHVDFSAEVERSLSVLDRAIIVVSAVEGVEAQTYTLRKELKKRNIPTMIFVNKMDRMGADYERTLEQIRNKLEKNIVSLVSADTSSITTPMPTQDLAKNLAEMDCETLEEYTKDKKSITDEWLFNKLKYLVQTTKVFPVCGGSALKDQGIHQLLSYISQLASHKDYKLGKLSAFVYSVKVDKDGKKAYVKVISGELKNRETVEINEENKEKIKGLYRMANIELIPCDHVVAGEIAVIKGLGVNCGDYIGDNPGQQLSFVQPLLIMRVFAVNTDQSFELMNALKILNEEDPHLNLTYDSETKQTYISLMGEVQVQIIITTLTERFNIQAEISSPIVIYKETPTKTGRGKASYTSVSGIELEISPLPTGTGVIFTSKFSTDFLLKKYQSQTERLVKRYLKQGLLGWEVTDCEVAIVGGRFDSMGSDPLHFNISAPLALMRALKKSKIKLLEPIISYTLSFPKADFSTVQGILPRENSNYKIIRENDNEITLEGEAPLRLMLDFSNRLSKATSGMGMYSSQLSRYDTATDQTVSNQYFGPDPRNETKFLISDMKGSAFALDKPPSKKKKESKSKFKREQKKKNRSK